MTRAAPGPPGAARIPTLDGWRGVAVAMVVAAHAVGPLLHAGKLPEGWVHAVYLGRYGVALFFGLSGLLICTNSGAVIAIRSPSNTAMTEIAMLFIPSTTNRRYVSGAKMRIAGRVATAANTVDAAALRVRHATSNPVTAKTSGHWKT